jgi:hypothetical protein
MKKYLHVCIITIAITMTLTLLSPASVFGQTINQDALKLIKISGTTQAMEQMIDMALAQMQQMAPNLSPALMKNLKDKINSEEVLQMYVPIYTKHYTHDEIKQLIKFYESPLGRKVVKTMPAMAQESVAIAEKWNEQLIAEIMQELMSGGLK